MRIPRALIIAWWGLSLCWSVAAAGEPKTAAEAAARGDKCRRVRDWDGAIAAYTRAIELDPRNATACGDRAEAYRRKGQLIKALADCTAAIRLDAKSSLAYAQRAEIYRELADTNAALADVAEAIRLDPIQPCSYLIGAVVCHALTDPAAATHAKDEESLLYRALCLARHDRYEEAIAAADAAIGLNPAYAWGYEVRGALRVAHGEVGRGVGDFETMLHLDPLDAANEYQATSGWPVREHGWRQLRQMLKDRPAMARYGDQAAGLYEWAARKFADDDRGRETYWDATDPAGTTATHRPPMTGSFGVIQVPATYSQGPQQGQPRGFEELWRDVVSGLNSISGTSELSEAAAAAAAGKLTKEQFVARVAPLESRAAEQTRAFYLRVFLPWAREHHVSTTPALWYVAYARRGEGLVLSRVPTGSEEYSRYCEQCYDSIVAAARARETDSGNDVGRAIAAATAAIRRDPKSADAYLRRGAGSLAADDYPAAIAYLSEAIRLNPKLARAFILRGWAYRKSGQSEKGIADLTEYIRLCPDRSDGFYWRAFLYEFRGQAKKALADCSESIRLAPSYAPAYYLRGMAHRDEKDFAACIADLTVFIRGNPKEPYALFYRGESYGKTGELDKAIADYAAAQRLKPDWSTFIVAGQADLYARRGRARLKKGDWDAAIADLTEAHRLWSTLQALRQSSCESTRGAKTDSSGASANTGNVPFADTNAGKPQAPDLGAIDLHAPIHLRPDPPKAPSASGSPPKTQSPPADPTTLDLASAHTKRGSARAAKRDFGGAIADFTRAVGLTANASGSSYQLSSYQLYDGRKHALVGRASAYQKLGKHAEAIADLTEAIKLDGYDAALYLNRGRSHRELGQLDAARADLDEAIRLAPACREAYECRAAIYRQSGEKAKAQADLLQAKRLGGATK